MVLFTYLIHKYGEGLSQAVLLSKLDLIFWLNKSNYSRNANLTDWKCVIPHIP